MQRMYIMIFSLCVLISCCKQYEGKVSDAGKNSKDVARDISRRSISSVVPDIPIKKAKSPLVVGALDNHIQNNQDDVVNLREDVPGIQENVPGASQQSVIVETDKKKTKTLEEESYDEFKASLSKLKALYYYRPEGFNDYMLSGIESEFNFEYDPVFKEKFYAILKGDVKTLRNLQKIVVISHPDRELKEYLSGDEFRVLFSKLKDIAESTICRVINEHWGVFSTSNLTKLAMSKDVAGFDSLKAGLDEFCTKWKEMTILVQNVIDDVAKSRDRNNILQRVQTVTNLIPLNSNQQCNTQICEVKNGLNLLRVKLAHKVDQLIREIYLWL
ncbi:hypothetical protein [Borrelia persica]|uniref:hypothetical protein n=1 Tax=Borrelia persica TaxID=44448 RepID=UPI0004677A13|nr:hypothetical protein [Borrelia persica]